MIAFYSTGYMDRGFNLTVSISYYGIRLLQTCASTFGLAPGVQEIIVISPPDLSGPAVYKNLSSLFLSSL